MWSHAKFGSNYVDKLQPAQFPLEYGRWMLGTTIQCSHMQGRIHRPHMQGYLPLPKFGDCIASAEIIANWIKLFSS